MGRLDEVDLAQKLKRAEYEERLATALTHPSAQERAIVAELTTNEARP